MTQHMGAKKALTDLATAGMLILVCGVIYYIYNFFETRKQNQLKNVYEGIPQVCNGVGLNGNPPYNELSGIHPAVAVLQNGNISLEYIPENARKESGDSIELVLCIQESEEILIQTCPYSDEKYVNRIQEKLNISLREAASGEEVANASLISEIPQNCKPAEQFATTSEGRTNKTFVSIPQVRDWVAHYSNIGSNGLITPTQASTPASIVKPLSTLTKISSPVIEGFPSDWLPNSEDFPSELKFERGDSLSNDDIANQSPDPIEVTNRLSDEGRINGYFLQYIHKDGCNLKNGLFEIQFQTGLYKDSDGAQKAFYWLRSNSGVTRSSYSRLDGDYYFFANINSPCDSSVILRYVNMTFRRLNVVSTVFVISIEGSMSDEEMLGIAEKYADLIDAKLVDTAK